MHIVSELQGLRWSLKSAIDVLEKHFKVLEVFCIQNILVSLEDILSIFSLTDLFFWR